MGVSAWPITPANKWLGLRIKDPWKYQNLTFSDYLAITERDRTVNVRLQEASLHHSHMAECYDYGAKRVYAVRELYRIDAHKTSVHEMMTSLLQTEVGHCFAKEELGRGKQNTLGVSKRRAK